GLRERDASVSLPPKFALELLTIYAWEEGTGRAEQFSTAEGFCTVMNLLIQYQELCIYWTEYYSLEEPIIGAHIPIISSSAHLHSLQMPACMANSLQKLHFGTTLDDNSDADLVIFLNCFSNYRDQAAMRASVISTIEQNLLRCHRSLAFNIDILPPRVKGPISQSFPLQDKYKPPSKVYTDLIQAGGKPGEFNTSFTELQRNFVKHCPAKVKGLLRLVKHWYKECKKVFSPRSNLSRCWSLTVIKNFMSKISFQPVSSLRGKEAHLDSLDHSGIHGAPLLQESADPVDSILDILLELPARQEVLCNIGIEFVGGGLAQQLHLCSRAL
ncbi:hypothetical protein JD844_012518, partial [Phrynosoma platyrhinos]